MSKPKPPKNPFPEMETLLEGMQELLTDERGNPLPQDHPHYQRVTNFLNQLNMTMEQAFPPDSQEEPKGTA